ncbi:MAG: glutaredoxin family protein [Candidatus Promineifilaceae bacterium]
MIITLYTKAGCTPCNNVKTYLALREHVYPHELVEVDITQDRDTFAYYRYIIPVVKIGETTLSAPILNGAIESALKQASYQ